MKNLGAEALAHFAQECTTTALCWLVELRDGTKIRGTEHDQDIVLDIINSPNDELELGGTYYARANISGSNMKNSSDMSVDNMEVVGATGEPGDVDITVAQIENGVTDKAPVTIFLVNWKDANAFQIELRRGYLGESFRDSDGMLKTEVRGMTQPLSQNIGQTYATDCNVVEFGDDRCKYPVASITRDAVITAVTSRRAFTVSTVPNTAPAWPTQFYNGKVRFITGLNTGFTREVKIADRVGGNFNVEVWDPFANAPLVGDSLKLVPGCDRTKSNCKLYANVVNMRAYGVFIPGIDALMKGPT
jgi:uncharacterized phage protein (TIGR02218 family)